MSFGIGTVVNTAMKYLVSSNSQHSGLGEELVVPEEVASLINKQDQ
jgi:hypothetical protein